MRPSCTGGRRRASLGRRRHASLVGDPMFSGCPARRLAKRSEGVLARAARESPKNYPRRRDHDGERNRTQRDDGVPDHHRVERDGRRGRTPDGGGGRRLAARRRRGEPGRNRDRPRPRAEGPREGRRPEQGDGRHRLLGGPRRRRAGGLARRGAPAHGDASRYAGCRWSKTASSSASSRRQTSHARLGPAATGRMVEEISES